MFDSPTSPPLQELSGEQLLLAAIFGEARTRTRIDRELDRRANSVRRGERRTRPVRTRASATLSPAA